MKISEIHLELSIYCCVNIADRRREKVVLWDASK